MSLKSEIAIKSLVACATASIICACSSARPGDGKVVQDTPITSEAPMDSGSDGNSETDSAEVSNPGSSHLSTLATATTFESLGVTLKPYCEESDPSECSLDVLPWETNGGPRIPEPSNPYRLVRQDNAFDNATGNSGGVLFPADLDTQLVAFYVPKYSLSDVWETRSYSDDLWSKDDVWYETALLPVVWKQTGCSGIMGVTLYRGITEHPRNSFFFVDENGVTSIETSFSYGQTKVELTESGYQLNTEDGVTAALTLKPDDEGQCVATVQKDNDW